MIDWDEKIHMGSINGKNTDIYLTVNEMIIDVFEDPYLIYTFIETHRDLVVEGCGYLDKVVAEKKKTAEESDVFSEELSEEETDSSTDSGSDSGSDSSTDSSTDSGSD